MPNNNSVYCILYLKLFFIVRRVIFIHFITINNKRLTCK